MERKNLIQEGNKLTVKFNLAHNEGVKVSKQTCDLLCGLVLIQVKANVARCESDPFAPRNWSQNAGFSTSHSAPGQTGLFGSSAQAETPGSNTTSALSTAFGANTASAPAFGSTSSAAFGSTAAQTTPAAFGSVNQTTPSQTGLFGSKNNNQTSLFGTKSTQGDKGFGVPIQGLAGFGSNTNNQNLDSSGQTAFGSSSTQGQTGSGYNPTLNQTGFGNNSAQGQTGQLFGSSTNNQIPNAAPSQTAFGSTQSQTFVTNPASTFRSSTFDPNRFPTQGMSDAGKIFSSWYRQPFGLFGHKCSDYFGSILIKFVKVLQSDKLKYSIKLSSDKFNVKDKVLSLDDTWYQVYEYERLNSSPFEFTFDITVHINLQENICSFETLYNDMDLTDFKLRGEDGSIPIHKAILASYSPIFKILLSSKWRELSEGIVEVAGTSKTSLQHLKDYMYLHRVPETGLKHLLIVASFYKIPDLEYKCSVKLLYDLTAPKAFELLEFAFKHKLKILFLGILEHVQSGLIKVKDIELEVDFSEKCMVQGEK